MSRLSSDRLIWLESAVNNVMLEADGLTPLNGDQLRLTNERWEPHKAEALLNRLRARCGQAVVFQVCKLDELRSASLHAWTPRRTANPSQPCIASSISTLPSLVRRRLASPVMSRVKVDEKGLPTGMYLSGRYYSVTTLMRTRASGGWWRSDAYAFEDFSVLLKAEGLYWLRYMPKTAEWYLMGGWD